MKENKKQRIEIGRYPLHGWIDQHPLELAIVELQDMQKNCIEAAKKFRELIGKEYLISFFIDSDS